MVNNMRGSLRIVLLASLLIAAIGFSLIAASVAHSGAPIPVNYGGYWSPAARSNCLLTYRADKSGAIRN